MKKSGVIKAVITILIILLIVGVYYFFTTQRRTSVEDTVELTEIQKLITKNLDTNYPATPREVVKYYNRILECFYDDTYTDDELESLADRARKLLDDELLENNPRISIFPTEKRILKITTTNQKRFAAAMSATAMMWCIRRWTGECAYVTASYFMNENNSFDRTNEMYVLRKR